jgi:hypothetical protein
MVLIDFSKDMNFILALGVHISPIEIHEQKMSAINKIGRIGGISLSRLKENGKINEITIISVFVFFSTTITRFSYHANLSLPALASVWLLQK